MGEFIGFPNPLARESEKESKDYGLSFFKAMYRAWAGENETLLDQRSIRYRRARQYAGGYQDEDQYKDLLNKEGDLSYLNLNWDIVPIIPKFIDLVVNSITNYEFDIKARAIDPVSSDKRKKKEMDLKTKMLSKKFMKELQEISGMPLVEDNEFIPETEDEVNLFMQLSYKQASEIAIEQGLELAMTINDWTELSKRIVRDLVVLGISSVKTELDHRGVIIRYVDPEFLVTSTSEHPDFKDITWAGEIRRVRISDLKAEAGNQISEKEYEHIADRFRGRHGNPTSFDRQPYMDGTFTRYDYDRFLVDVLEGQFIVPNKLRAEKKYNRYGNYTIHRK